MTWETVPLSAVAKVEMGQAPVGDSYNDRGEGVGLIAGPGDFRAGKFTVKKFTSRPTKLSRAGDLVIGIRASIGDLVVSDGTYCLGRGVAAIRPDLKSVDHDYLRHTLAWRKDELTSRGRGATFLTVSRADIASLPIPLPPLPEQRRIAAILDEADALRTACAREAEAAQAAADALFDRAVLGTGDMAPLSAFVDLITGPFGSSVHRHDYVDGGIPLINPSHIVDGDIKPDSLIAVGTRKAVELSSFHLREGDVVLGRRGDMGRTALVRACDLPALCGTGTMILRSRDGFEVGAYISRLLRTPRYVALLTAAASGVTMLNLSQQAVATVLVPTPSAELEARVAAADSESRVVRESIERRARHLDSLFASLQHRAFRGEL